VVDYGDAVIDLDDRLEQVNALGVDEHTFQHATATRRTQMATRFVDLDRGRLLDVTRGRSGQVVRDWVDALSRPSADINTILARTTSRYGNVYLRLCLELLGAGRRSSPARTGSSSASGSPSGEPTRYRRPLIT
jgi:hypothetical protein